MKILHTSDWHLGRQFHNVPLLDDQMYVIDQMIDAAIQQSVDVFIIAGDIFDRTVPPANSVAYFNDVLGRLHSAGIRVIAISGNHDGAERLGFGSSVLVKRNVHIVTELSQLFEPITIEDGDYTVILYPLAFVEPINVRRFLQSRSQLSANNNDDLFAQSNADCFDHIVTHDSAYKALIETLDLEVHQKGVFRILIAHCFVDGASSSESERPLAIGTLETVDPIHFDPFDYVALGHLHGRQFRRRDTIRYSGTPFKYSFSEVDHVKSYTVISIGESGLEFEQVPLTPLRDLRKISGYFSEILTEGKKSPSDDYLYVDLLDTHALLDVMPQLRECYPNVLTVERSGLMSRKNAESISGNKSFKNIGEKRLFEDFYQQMTGHPMSDQQEKLISNLLNQLNKDNSK
jgi:exonuclease SbcD